MKAPFSFAARFPKPPPIIVLATQGSRIARRPVPYPKIRLPSVSAQGLTTLASIVFCVVAFCQRCYNPRPQEVRFGALPLAPRLACQQAASTTSRTTLLWIPIPLPHLDHRPAHPTYRLPAALHR